MATMIPRLTIVLPLKGRPLFTLRFLWHANVAGLPYHFLIADGEARPALTEALQNAREHFPNLQVEYQRYPDDTDFRHYFAKMTDALQRVRTPYVMLADNDDFLVRAGIERSIDFLDANPDYVCCGGGIGGFAIHSDTEVPAAGLCGPFNRLAFRYMPYDRSADYGSPSVTERLVSGLRNSWSYYAVFRTPALQTVWREVAEMDLSDLQLHEKYCAMRTLTLGKVRSDPATIAYLRQYWTTLRSAFARDWVHHLFHCRFSADFANVLDRISRSAAVADGVDPAVVSERILGVFTPWFSQFLKRNYGPFAALRARIRRVAPEILSWLKTRRRHSVLFDRRSLFGALRKTGASVEYLKTFETELAQIEEIVRGAGFRDFTRRFAAEIKAEG